MVPMVGSGRLGIAEITLSDGSRAIVDLDVAPMLRARRWFAHRDAVGRVRAVVANATVRGKVATLYMHRMILGLRGGDRAAIDHVNLDPLDNRRSNLRVASNAQNARNCRKYRGGTSSRFKGVSASRGRWAAQIRLAGRLHRLGRFASETEAAKEYDFAAKAMFGKFARANFYGE